MTGAACRHNASAVKKPLDAGGHPVADVLAKEVSVARLNLLAPGNGWNVQREKLLGIVEADIPDHFSNQLHIVG